ncbi:MAG: bactofilin family protein [Myxococcota bacterium]
MAILRKEDSAIPTAASIAVGQTHTILGPESSFDGKLTFQGAVRIDGRFAGEIFTDDVLVIGESAEVKATLDVGSLILNGTMRGNVRAKKAVELHAPARLYGDIETPSLVMHQGVIFEGNCRMENLGAKKADPALRPVAAPAERKESPKT